MKLSIISPVYNEEEVLLKFHDKLSSTVKDLQYEIIYINDGSKDNSYKVLNNIYNMDKKHVKVITFSRNFGKDAAIYAGLKSSTGDMAAIIDSDLQQNPSYLLRMYKFLTTTEEFDCVCMVQKDNKKRFFQKIFYKTISKMSNMNFTLGASDFRMFKRNVINALLSLDEKIRFSKGIFSFVGFNTYYEPYNVEKRLYGESKFNFKNKIKYALEGIIGYSIKPLRIATITGIIISASAFLYLLFVIIRTIIYGIDTPGYASLICIVLFMGGMQLLAIGILGEYLSKTYLEVKNRPVYIVKDKKGFNDNIL